VAGKKKRLREAADKSRDYPTCAMQVPDCGYMQKMPQALTHKALTAIKTEALP
jgi:hypothetical protein